MESYFKPFSLNIRQKLYTINEPCVMGILNVTDDSFFDGGRYVAIDQALNRVEQMLKEGVDIIDIGGQSTRPGAIDVGVSEELARTIPVIEAISSRFPDAVLSIDTFRAEVAQKAVEAGVGIVNDVSAGDDDANMISTVSKLKVPYIAMHKQGTPLTMQNNPVYNDVTGDVLQYCAEKKWALKEAGIKDLIIDPGFGFGKTTEQNYRLLSHLEVFHSLNCPILIGVSRKGMIWKVLGSSPEQALPGTIAANTIALLKGVHIIRVHDVKAAKDAIAIVSQLV
ncbi:MAG: dihydropteroate synthase [Bacteroidota bacterium]